MTNVVKARVIYIIGLVIACGVPLIVALFQFPLWKAKGGGYISSYTLSGAAIVLIPFCLIPFWRHIKEYFKNPSAWLLWSIIFIVFYIIDKIAAEIVIISAFGAVANIIAAILFYLSKKIKEKPDVVIVEQDQD